MVRPVYLFSRRLVCERGGKKSIRLQIDPCVFQSSPFWIIAKAVRDFVDNEGRGLLPLKGTLPDMTADTEKYVALQQMYDDIA